MSITLNPYLMFDGQAAAAVELYQRALSAKLEAMSHFGDVPGNSLPEEVKSRVMHAKLQIGSGVVMISDCMPGRGTIAHGNASHVALHFTDLAEEARCFEALAQGGTIETPLQDMFWGARWGSLVDRFGVQWMFHCELPQQR